MHMLLPSSILRLNINLKVYSKTCKLRIDYAKILKRIWNICESRTLTSYSKNSVAGNIIFGKDHGKQNTQPCLVWSLVICQIAESPLPLFQ